MKRMRNIFLVLTGLILFQTYSDEIVKYLSVMDISKEDLEFDEYINPAKSIIVFLSPDCPVTASCMAPLNLIYEQYPKKDFIGIIPEEYTSGQMSRFQKNYNIKFPVVRDKGKVYSKIFKSENDNQVYILDSLGKVSYKGTLDGFFRTCSVAAR